MPCQNPDHQPHQWETVRSTMGDIRRWARRCQVPVGSEEYQLAGTWLARMTHRDEPLMTSRALATAAHIVVERGSGKWSALETLDMVSVAYDNHLIGTGYNMGPDRSANVFFKKFVGESTSLRGALLWALSESKTSGLMTGWRYAALCDPEFSESSAAWEEVTGQARHVAANREANPVEVLELNSPILGFMVMRFFD